MKPLLSCVVPVKGLRPFMEAVLDSLRCQGMGDDLEIIIQDGDVEPDKGQSDALNKGFAKSHGEWLFWLNADDMLLPCTLKKVKAIIRSSTTTSDFDSLQWIAGNVVEIDKDGRILRCVADRGRKRSYEGLPVRTCGPSSFFRRELFEKVGGFDVSLRYAMDTDLWCKFRAAGHWYRKLPGYTWAFRIHDGSKTGSPTNSDEELKRQRDEILRLNARHHIRDSRWAFLGFRVRKILDGSYWQGWRDTRRMRGLPIAGRKSLVLWVHSACRSTVALYRTAKCLAEAEGWQVTVCEWGLKHLPEERLESLENPIPIGDDLEKGRAVLREQGGPESVQVFCVYQNSSVWRQLIVEAKRGGARVVVYSEAPCEMCLGLRAWLKRLYYRWVLPWRVRAAVKAADLFISSSGEMGIDRLMRLGWSREKIVPFGYASPRLTFDVQGLKFDVKKVERVERLRVLHLGSEAEYRGVKIAEEAAKIAGVELVKTGGKMSEEELVREIRRADLVVGCGYCEPWGMRINDALLEGTPVIVSDGMGAAVVCDWYGCGCVVPKGDAQALAKVLKRCKDEPEFLERLRSGAKVAAKELLPENRARVWLSAVLGKETVGRPRPRSVVASFWEEHCTECAAPACYGTCGMFERGWHGRCARVDGFEESVLGTGTMRFRRWGKIELMYHGRMMSVTAAERVGRLNLLCRGLWRLLGAYHRAVRWRLTSMLGRRGAPNVWRIRMRSARNETLCAAIAYEDGREVFRAPLLLAAGEEQVFELHIPTVNDRALFRLFPLNGEATGPICIDENRLMSLTTNHQPLTTNHQSPTTNIKCVAWDLDGVIWDGTLSEGEDVKVRPEVMESIKALDQVGIVSSICSKNDEGMAIEKLKTLGIEEWFVFPQINWGPKSENIKKLAKEMNIGLDAIAFVDDREENREDVRANCPGVRVYDEKEGMKLGRVEVEKCRESGGDGGLGNKRRLMYREEMVRRGAARQLEGDSAAFAAVSGLTFELLSVDVERIDRCRELVQRTNQLNLTARRYDEKAFAALLKSADCTAVHVWDKYGDYGIVGFLAVQGTHIVECCFSCRSAGRGIERRVLERIAAGRKMTADIVETERNAPIREIVEELRFEVA